MVLLSGISIFLATKVRSLNNDAVGLTSEITDFATEVTRLQNLYETQKKLIKLQNINIESRKKLREQENKSCHSSGYVA